MIKIKTIPDLPIFHRDDDIVSILLNSFSDFQDGDILVFAQKIISRVEGQEIQLSSVTPSKFALKYCKNNKKNPQHVETILNEAKSIVRMNETLIITETRQGFVCANAGVDRSNTKSGHVILLPIDPDRSARNIQSELFKRTSMNLGIIISDTFGRPFRKGTTNIAIGVAGFQPLKNFHGKKDLFDYELQTTEVCVADELATAAGLVMGQSNEGSPIILIRGSNINLIPPDSKTQTNVPSAVEIARPRESALFW
ncbi:MAG: coenzyme F420-0:L-glutamate ligase [Candidatus Hodarchaeales archaeon]|jgi:coenzyme F420-0:L-glutamate ligase/coenzyme F420-1:gamma-L-glutamate ligase